MPYGVKAVSNPRFRKDIARFILGFNLAAELSDEDAQGFRLVYVVAAPDRDHECAAGDNPIGM